MSTPRNIKPGSDLPLPGLSPEEHRLRHVELHQAFDELLADWIRHVRTARPSTATVLELMQWSHQ